MPDSTNTPALPELESADKQQTDEPKPKLNGPHRLVSRNRQEAHCSGTVHGCKWCARESVKPDKKLSEAQQFMNSFDYQGMKDDPKRGGLTIWGIAYQLKVDLIESEQALSEACKERDEVADSLRIVDDALARRPAVADAPNRYTAICRAFDAASKNERRANTADHWDMHYKIQLQRAEKAESELTEARTLLANQAAGMRRLIDLVRHQRGELFAEQLISAEELAALVADSESGQRVARLESYDAMREKIKSQAAEIATLREKANGK